MDTLAGLAILTAVFALGVMVLMGVMNVALRIGGLLVTGCLAALDAYRARVGRAR